MRQDAQPAHTEGGDVTDDAFATVWVNGRVVGVWREPEAAIELLLWQDVEVVIKPYPPDIYVRNPFTLGER